MKSKIWLSCLLSVTVISGLSADLYYTPSEYRKLYNEKYALELELKYLNEQFINERLKLKNRISELEKQVTSLEERIADLIEQKNKAAADYSEQIQGLEREIIRLKNELSNLQKAKQESERQAALRVAELEKKIESLKKSASEREQSLIEDAQSLEKEYLKEIEKLNNKLKEERQKHSEEIDRLTRTNQKEVTDLQNRLSEAESEINDLQTENRRLKEQVSRLESQLERKEQRLKDIADQADSLARKLEKEIEEGNLRLKRENNRLVINMDNRILFKSGQAKLRGREIEDTLDKIAGILADYPENKVFVEGHTDNVPMRSSKFKDNWELSTERALSVLRRLLNNRKLDASRFYAIGAGQYQPLVPNNSKENRALNRRVDIVVLPQTAN